MGCTLGVRIIHLQEDLLHKTAKEGSADLNNQDLIRVGIQNVSPARIHDGADVLNRISPDSTFKATDARIDRPKTAALDHAMSGACPAQFHQEDKEMFPSICKAQGKKPTSLQNTRVVNFPSLTFPCSPRKSRSMPLNSATLVSSERESVRMRALRGLIQKQLSDVSDGRRSRLPPICPSKLRKSSSCNDSWLQEIVESDEVQNHCLPSINEVDPTGAESKILASVEESLTVNSSRPVSMRSLQTRTSWLTSCNNAKRNATSMRDRSPMASMENPRLPVILEDLDNGNSLGNSPMKFSSKSLDVSAADTLESRSLLQVPKMAIPTENSVWLAFQERQGEIPITDVITDEQSKGTTHGYSKTMAEVLGLNDSICIPDSDILENMTVDPSSPLLVNFVSKFNDNNADETPAEMQISSNDKNSQVEESREDSTNGNTMSAMEEHDSSTDNAVLGL